MDRVEQSENEVIPEMVNLTNAPNPATTNPEVRSQIDPQAIVESVTIPRPDKQRHYIAAFLFSLYFGWLGVDRFYLAKYFTGILKMLTLGGLGFWAVIDTRLIMVGAMKDHWGNPLLDAKRYRKFARNTVLFTYLAVFLFILLMVISVILAIPQLQSSYDQILELNKLLNGSGQYPGL